MSWNELITFLCLKKMEHLVCWKVNKALPSFLRGCRGRCMSTDSSHCALGDGAPVSSSAGINQTHTYDTSHVEQEKWKLPKTKKIKMFCVFGTAFAMATQRPEIKITLSSQNILASNEVWRFCLGRGNETWVIKDNDDFCPLPRWLWH